MVDRSYQIRTAMVAVLGMAFLVVLSAVLVHLLSLDRARALLETSPALAHGLTKADMRTVLFIIGTGVLFVVAIFGIEILETHKTAGVVYRVTRGLRDVESGYWGTRLTLRKNDNFKEMEEAFNSAAAALGERLEEDLHSLQSIEGQIRLASRELESGNGAGSSVLLGRVGGEIQALREQKRNLLSSVPEMHRERKI
ncbi:MAG: hypothetical protein V3U83_05245 [Acidobacteriota bacterium]